MTWLTNECADTVALFWSLSGEPESFPRSLERPLALALPVALVKLPRLQLKDIENWLLHRDVPFSFHCQSRYVRGCLVACGGKGIIFVDGTDPIDQIRVTLAHEIAHFLLDYWLPRCRAIQNLGASIVEVLDGIRPPSIEERVHSLLVGLQIGIHTNLLERGHNDADLNTIWHIEDKADKIAVALLAPPDTVLQQSDLSAKSFQERKDSIVSTLTSEFGLPTAIAEAYGVSLLSAIGKGPSWAESLSLH